MKTDLSMFVTFAMFNIRCNPNPQECDPHEISPHSSDVWEWESECARKSEYVNANSVLLPFYLFCKCSHSEKNGIDSVLSVGFSRKSVK